MPKIITLTLSPALDVEYHSAVANTGLNRTKSHKLTAGGKGINVARAVLDCARCDNADPYDVLTAVFPYGGITGGILCHMLADEGIPALPIEIAGNTRINTSLIPESGKEIEINAPGTPVGDRLGVIEGEILSRVVPGDVVCICGSVPADVAKDYPAKLCAKIKKIGGIVALDCDGEALVNAAAVSPGEAADLIKPNEDELGMLLGATGGGGVDEGSLLAVAGSLPFAQVIVTMAGDGAYFCRKDVGEVFFTSVRKVRPVRLKGAGDTFLGAFVYAKYIRGDDDRAAMRFAADTASRYVAGG